MSGMSGYAFSVVGQGPPAPPTSAWPVKIFDSNGNVIRATVAQELKVAQLYTLADLTAKYNLDPVTWDVQTVGGGTATHVPAESALRVAVDGAAGSASAIRTNTYFKYQAGYTQLISMSIINSDAGQPGQTRRWGYFDSEDGLLFQLVGNSFAIVERSSTSGAPVDTSYPQAVWNVDPLDGSGPSGVTLDVANGNLYEIEIQWFGVGTVRYFINGILVHEIEHGNAGSSPYTRTGTLPIEVEIVNTGPSSPASVTEVCTRVAAQAQVQSPFYLPFSAANFTPRLIGTVAPVPVLSVRPKALFNAIVNRAWVIPKLMTVNTEDYRIRYEIVANGSLTGPVWASAGADSSAEYDVSSSSVTGGTVIYEGFINTDGGTDSINLQSFYGVASRLIRLAGFNGTGANVADVITVVVLNTAVGNTNVKANLSWNEVR